MRVDRLFLERGCPHCGSIRAILDMEAVVDDGFQGKDGQSLHVFSSQSNAASEELLDKFGLKGKFIPLLQTHDGEVIEKPGVIIERLKKSGMAIE